MTAKSPLFCFKSWGVYSSRSRNSATTRARVFFSIWLMTVIIKYPISGWRVVRMKKTLMNKSQIKSIGLPLKPCFFIDCDRVSGKHTPLLTAIKNSDGEEIFREPVEHDGFSPQFSLRWNHLKKNHQFSDIEMSRQAPHGLRPQWYR